MKNKYHWVLISWLGLGILASAQTRRDPRGMALGGAYGSLSRGIFAVDYNPANLAIPHEYDAYRIFGGLGTSFSTNFLSIKQYRKYNDQNLEAGDGREYFVKMRERIPRFPGDLFQIQVFGQVSIDIVNRTLDALIEFHQGHFIRFMDFWQVCET